MLIGIPQIGHRLVSWLLAKGWLIGQPQGIGWLVAFSVCFHQQDTASSARILASMKTIPTTETDLAPSLIGQINDRLGFTPRLWLFESEAVAVNSRAAITAVGSGSLMQHTVATHPDQNPTRFLFQCSKEVMVAILAIGHDEVEGSLHFRLAVTAQLLDLVHSYFDVRLLTGNPPDRQSWRPTAVSFRCPRQDRVRVPNDDRLTQARIRRTINVLPVGHAPRRRVRPECAIQWKD
jgi:hypothetical protein